MVERHRDVPHRPHDDLAVAHDGSVGDAVEAEDRDLGVVDERRHEQPAELARARDGERRVAELVAASVPARAALREPPHLGVDLVDGELLAAAHDRHDEAVVRLHRDPDVDPVEEHDLVALEAGVEHRERRPSAAADAWIACATSPREVDAR